MLTVKSNSYRVFAFGHSKSPVGTSNYGGTNASYYVYWRDDLGNFHRNKIRAVLIRGQDFVQRG